MHLLRQEECRLCSLCTSPDRNAPLVKYCWADMSAVAAPNGCCLPMKELDFCAAGMSHFESGVGTPMVSYGNGSYSREMGQMKQEQMDSPCQRKIIKEEQFGSELAEGNAVRGAEEESSEQMDQTDLYRELILRHLIADISGTCTKLGLSTELVKWTGDDCARWVAEMCAQFQMAVPPSSSFQRLDGRQMLALSVDEFQARFPDGGDTLHAQLQLWKTAFESCGQLPPSSSMNSNTISFTNSQHFDESSPWMTVGNEFAAPSSSSCSGFSSASSASSASSFQQYNSNNNNYTHQPSHASPSKLLHLSHQQYPQVGQLHPSSDCSTAESVSPSHSSVAPDEEFMGQMGDIGPGAFFLAAQSKSAPILPASGQFCHQFARSDQFLPSSAIHHQMQQQQQQQPAVHPMMKSQPQQRVASHGAGGTIHLWHFIRELLEQPKEYGACVRWVDRKEGTFKIESSHHLARYWGLRKNRAAMNYDKLSRSLRQYYKKGIIQKPEKKQRLVYKFLPPYNQ